jgi:hypothetical protein
MKCIAPLLLVLLLSFENTCAQDIGRVTISIDLQQATLKQALDSIEKFSLFRFTYKSADIAAIRDINYRQQNVSVKKILDDLLPKAGLQYEAINNYILIKKTGKSPPRLATLHGFVTAERSGEALIGATVVLQGSKAYATTTNAYGFYSLSVSPGEYTFTCSHIGFSELDQQLSIEQGYQNNISLQIKQADTMQTVTVFSPGKRSIVRPAVTGRHRLDIAEIKKIAMGGGEPDVLKSLQFLPGIQASNEGTTNLSVRGGSYDQNLILLDEAPVYNPTHTLGFFSAFNADALKDVSIYKGVFPAQYGGRLSSVVDLRMKEGNNKEHEITGGIGVIASRLTWEGPIKKEKSSFMISGRFSDVGSLLNMADAFSYKTKLSFYDFNIKVNSFLGKKDRVYLSAYTGHDNFHLGLVDFATQTKWGNTTVTARWNHVFNSRLFANTSILYSNYNYSYYTLDGSNYSWKANLKEVTLKTDFDWSIGRNSLLKTGAGVIFQNVSPGSVIPHRKDTVYKSFSLDNRRSAQLYAYLQHDQQISKSISIAYGVRVTSFAALGGRTVYSYNADTTMVTDSTYYAKGKVIRSYFTAEPKITLRILLNPVTSFKIAWGRNYQFQHLLTNSSVGLPTDMWMPSDTYFKPQHSDHFTAGLYRVFAEGKYEASVEAYYQHSENIIDFRDNAEVFLNDKIETQVLPGQAKGYGIEFLLKKNNGLSTGWISYTWSKALRQVPGVNNNEWYPPTYDRRHNFSFVFNRTISKRLSASVNWVFRSGGKTTLPLGTYIFHGYRIMYYSARNGYTLPAHHRLDLSLTWQEKIRKKRKWTGEWVLSIYNAYHRKNVFALYVRQFEHAWAYSKAYQVYLGGIIPTITYNFKF